MYPIGVNNRHDCLYSLDDEKGELNPTPLDYITARKQIYYPRYRDSVQQHPVFKKLQQRLNRGEHLLIIEVDGPHEDDLAYYMKRYGVDNDFITNNTMVATPENLTIMLHDPTHPFGHGYCLAACLLNIDLA